MLRIPTAGRFRQPAAGLLRLLRWLLDMLRLRSAADRPVRQLPAGRFQTGRLPAERSQAGCFQIERLRLPGRLQAGQLQHAVRQCPPAENRGIPGIRSGLNVFG